MKSLKTNNLNFMKNFIFVLNTAKVKISKIIIILFFTLSIVFLDALGIGILLPISEYILHQKNGELPETQAWGIINKVFSYINFSPNIAIVTTIAVTVVVIRQILNYFKAVKIQTVRLKVIKEFRTILYKKLLNVDFLFMKNFTTGAYNNIVNNEVEKLGLSFIAPVELVSGLVLLISYLILMLIISVKASILVLLIGFVTFLFLTKFLNTIAVIAKNIITINNDFSQNLVERLQATKMIRLSRMEKTEVEKSNVLLESQYFKNIQLTKIQVLTNTSIEPILLMIAIPIIILSISLGFPLAKLGIFVITLARFIPVFRTFFNTLQGYVQYNASTKKIIYHLKKLDKQKEIRKGDEIFGEKIKFIEFKNIFFKYIDSKFQILKNISCIFKGGKINAIIGESGTGKSTIINMLTRLIEPDRGRILMNGKDLKNINVQNLRKMCSYIDQKPLFFKGSIYDNLSYGKKVSLKKCIEASILSNAHDFINKLPNKYNYQLGEAGSGLSGGQLQRLDITRGIIANKPLMILDEPTSNLDIKNKEGILRTLKLINKKTKNTMIIISHDKNTLKYCQNVILLKK